ncbi:MAG: hypothetical protein A4E19_06310 [Nitrospira sp. SG-bin1]|nr:MAG: hypothetical protein A4E19_06310 [Nitrospira sp. SG-bin1]
MRLPHSKLVFYVLTTTLLTGFTPCSRAEVGPAIDPDIPSYIAQESLSGRLSISVSAATKPLVQALADDLIRHYPELQITVISKRSHTGLAVLLAHRTEMMAMSRRMTSTEVGNCLLELGYKPIAVPVAHHTSAVLVRNDDPNAETFSSQHVQTTESTSVMPHRNTNQRSIEAIPTRYKSRTVTPLRINSMESEGYATPIVSRQVDRSYTLKRSLYLYIAKLPGSNAPEASTELIRYALSRQGQQRALDLGYVPLSFEEVMQMTSRWAALLR